MMPEGRWLPDSLTPEYRPEPCAYSIVCERPASTTVRHPALGDVPVCAECAALYGRLQPAEPEQPALFPDRADALRMDDEPEPADLDPRGDREDAEQYGYEPGGDKR